MADGGRSVALERASMREVEAQVKTCQLCRLAKTRTNAVPGEGDVRAEVMLIGEGPGYHEDRQGRPFVGAAGQFLNELLDIAGLDRGTVYIANVVKCRPPNNRDPMPDEIAACAPYLDRQIALINPRIIVTLGRYSMARFFPGERISQIHGTARLVEGRLCVAMYHPAAGLHQASLADIIRSDFRKLPIYVEQARKMLAQPAPGEEEERAAAAQERSDAEREVVVQQPETAAVLPGDLAPNGHAAPPDDGALRLKEAPTLANVEAPKAEGDLLPGSPQSQEDASPAEPGQKKAGKRKKAETRKEDYEQLTFF